MDHKESWDELKKWLVQGIEYMQQRSTQTTGEEQSRVKGKLDGLKTCLEQMSTSERINNLDR